MTLEPRHTGGFSIHLTGHELGDLLADLRPQWGRLVGYAASDLARLCRQEAGLEDPGVGPASSRSLPLVLTGQGEYVRAYTPAVSDQRSAFSNELIGGSAEAAVAEQSGV